VQTSLRRLEIKFILPHWYKPRKLRQGSSPTLEFHVLLEQFTQSQIRPVAPPF
jgi:hypothetical protein